MEKVNIAFIIYELGSGGQEKQMSLAVKSLLDNNVKPLLFIWNGDKNITQDYDLLSIGIKVIRLRGNFLSKVFQIRKVLYSKEIDIFQSWSILMNVITFFCSLNNTTHPIAALRSQLFGKYIDKNNIFNNIKIFPQLIFTKNIICNNSDGASQLNQFYEKLPLINKNVYILRNRSFIPKFKAQKKEKGKIITISCSSLLPNKNIGFIVSVISNLIQKFPNIIHYHFGKEHDDKTTITNHLNNLIKKKKLTKNFFLCGEKKSLDNYYLSSDLFIHASNIEGTPNSILEAISYGLPIISSNWGTDANHYVIDNYNGFVLNDFDINNWTKNIFRILENKDKLSKNSLRLAKQKIDFNLLYKDLENIYYKILK